MDVSCMHIYIYMSVRLPALCPRYSSFFSIIIHRNGTGSILKATVMPRDRDAEAELNLPPGFRFHATDEELIIHYLSTKASGAPLPVPIIADVDLYKFDPWQLPERALFGQREWYFFTPRDRKYPNGSRPNRAAGTGYWKATGADKPVTPKGSNRTVGIKKALVFYSGKAPKGMKTDWIMHEYRLVVRGHNSKKGSLRLDDWVLCRLYNKKNIWEKMQQKEEEEALSFTHEETDNSLWEAMGTNHQLTRESESEIDIERVVEYAWKQAKGRDYVDGNGTLDQAVNINIREDAEWFMDLNFDGFLVPNYLDFGSSNDVSNAGLKEINSGIPCTYACNEGMRSQAKSDTKEEEEEEDWLYIAIFNL